MPVPGNTKAPIPLAGIVLDCFAQWNLVILG